MKSDEPVTTKPDDHPTTAEISHATDSQGRREEADRQATREEDVRGHHEETVANNASMVPEHAAASLEAAAIGGARVVPRDQSRQSHAEPQARTALFEEDEMRRLRDRWSQIQGGFVDEPRRAVEGADTLVAEVMKRLADMFAHERTELERQWDRGDKVTTEDLRVALQRYHAFFDRMLSV